MWWLSSNVKRVCNKKTYKYYYKIGRHTKESKPCIKVEKSKVKIWNKKTPTGICESFLSLYTLMSHLIFLAFPWIFSMSNGTFKWILRCIPRSSNHVEWKSLKWRILLHKIKKNLIVGPFHFGKYDICWPRTEASERQFDICTL